MPRYIVMPIADGQWKEDRADALRQADHLAGLNPENTYYICRLEEFVCATTTLVHTLVSEEEAKK